MIALPAGALLAAVTACASHPAAATQPGMEAAYSMDCSGSGQSWDDCYKKAQRSCDHGYDVVSRSSDTTGVKHEVNDDYGKTQVYRTLVVICREPAVAP
jgi:hypothetical protein